MEAIASRLLLLYSRLEASLFVRGHRFWVRLEAIASRLEAIASRVEASLLVGGHRF